MEATPLTKSEQLLETIKQAQRTKKIVDVEMEMKKVVIFRSGTGCYGFYGSDVKEILPMLPVSWVPGLPPFIPGLITVRGDVESVIDLAVVLGDGDIKEPDSGMIIIVARNFFRSGIIIDSIEDVVDIPATSIKPPISTLNGNARELVAGEGEYEGGHFALLDVEKLSFKVRL